MKFFLLDEFREQILDVNTLDKEYDNARVKSIERPGTAFENIANETAHDLVREYRTLVWMLTSTEIREEFWRDMQKFYGRMNHGDVESQIETKALWDKLGGEGIPEHKRAGEMAKTLRVRRSTVDKQILRLKLRTKKPSKKKSRQ